MNRRKMMGFLGVFILCLACLWGVGGKVRAAEQGETAEKTISYDAAMRRYFKNWGIYLGKSGHCYYTYAKNIYGNRKNGIVIVGLQETVKEIRIPEKIKGKKVIAIHLVDCFVSSDDYYGELLSRAKKSFIKKSKTTSIVIPRYVDEISDDSIEQLLFLKKLKKFHVSSKNKHFSAKSGVLFTRDGKTLLNYPNKKDASTYRIPDGVKYISKESFCCAKAERIIMPDTIKRIEHLAFSDAHVRKITLSKNLSFIGWGAFSGSSLREITIPGKVKTISEDCFGSCNNLKKVVIKNGVRKISNRAFVQSYGLRKLVIPPSVKKIESPFTVDHHVGSNEIERDKESWRNSGITVYVKKNSYAYQKLSKNYWKKELGIKIKERR